MLLSIHQLPAATFTWIKNSGGNASGSWTNQANWSGGTLPTFTNDTANFATLDLTADSTITLDGNQTIGALTFGDTTNSTAASWLLNAGASSSSSLALRGTAPAISVSGLAVGEAAVINAVVTGTNGLTKSGTSYLQFNAANTYSGVTVLSGSDCRVSLGHDRALGIGKIQVGASSGDGQVWFQSAGTRTLTNDFEIRTVRWIIDWNTANGVAGGDLTVNGNILLNAGGSNVRDIFCGKNLTLNGNIIVTPTSNPFNKQGGSTLTLNGTNTFSGPTAINAGTLALNGAINSSGTVTVNSGTTLTGTGVISAPVSVQSGGNLTVGAGGSGKLTVGNLTSVGTAVLNFDLGATNNSANGLIQANGNLTLAGQLNISDLGGFTNGVYSLIHYTGTLANNGLALTMPLGYLGHIITNVPHEVRLQSLRAQAVAPRPDEYLSFTNQITLDWAAVSGVVAYRIYAGADSNLVAIATTNSVGIYLGQTTADSLTISNLAPNATDYWRVDYVLSDGSVYIGPVWSFTLVSDQDLFLDTWVATDALNRSLPGASLAGPPRTNRPVGIFYFLWHGKGALGSGPRDNTSIIAALNGGTGYTDPHNPWGDNPPWDTGPNNGVSWYWGQPQVGYYANDDEWVIRRHIALLQAAGVEVLGFDSTNGHPDTQAPYYTKIADVIRKMRREGFRVNLKFMFYTHGGSGGSPATVTWLYENFYKPGLYPELWFWWQGKPLIIGYPDGIAGDGSTPVNSEVRSFFAWRAGWANGSNPINEWQWIDTPTPQNFGYDSARTDIPEHMPVACGGWANGNLGRSQSNRAQPAYDKFHLSAGRTEGQGIFFSEQMFYGLKYDPQFLFVTGWNEWWAGAWDAATYCYTHLLSDCVPANARYFVDNYNAQYSRDIEPISGNFTDNYYYQMVAQNRMRKGVRPIPAGSSPKTINLAGDFSDWSDVAPAFYDIPGDTVSRNWPGTFSNLPNYTNNTGRNDFTLLKIARDSSNLFFYAECKSNLTSYTGSNWMVLFLDMDQSRATGWEGYDYAVNLSSIAAGTTTLLRTTNGWNWQTVRSDIPYKASGNKLMLRLSRLDLGLGADPIAFDFHWADNFQTNDIADFGVNGDSAPDRRFNYRYQTVVEQALGLSADDFESGKQSSWGESWTNGSRWSVTSATAYSSNHSAVCNSANGTGQSALVTRQDTSALAGLRVSFRYKLHGITNAQNAFVQYYSRTGWTNIRNLGRDQYVPVGQSWSYDERQDVWMQFADARLIAGADGQFFHTNFAFRIDGGGLTNASQSLWVDDFSLTGTALQTNAVLNRAPVFPPIPDQTVLAGRTLIVTNAASDTDAPPQTLTFAGVLPPTNSTIDPAAGTFTWRPTIAQSPQLTRVQLKAQDNGVPSLSATQSFWVTVNSPVRPQLLAAAGTNRKFALRVTGDYGPDYIIQAATNLCCSNGWTTQLITNSPAIPFWWADPQTNLAQRFYRVLLGP